MSFVKRIPLPISGLALGIASLGLNMEVALGARFGEFLPWVKGVCGVVATCIIVLVALRIAFDREGVREDFKNVVICSVFPTFYMACMVLATYFKPYVGRLAFALWALVLALQLVWMAVFIVRFILRDFDIKNVFPSWFVVFVGFVVGTTTAPAFGMAGVGKVVWYTGLIGYAIALLLVGYRFIVNREVPAPVKPAVAITLAPANLCLAGHLALVKAGVIEPILPLIYTLLALATISFVIAVLYCMPVAFGRFYPSFAAFTFPFVIASTAVTNLSLKIMPWLSPVASALQVLAVLIVAYVFVRYSVFLLAPQKAD